MLKPDLLATKFRCPSPPAHGIRRAHLAQRLNEGVALKRQVTLVSAPAGFGKTTCVGEWVQGLGQWPVAWLSLEAADDDPGRFLTYFIAALDGVGATVGREIDGILRAGQLPPAEAISTTLINDILELERSFLLVLDDYPVIQDRFILQVMEQLLDNLPPQLHLVLITREDPPLPLARLRANNRLTEVRAAVLRFSAAEADCFLNEKLGLSLSQPDVALLEVKTEGWIVGLQLAALALQGMRSAPGRQSTPDRGNASRFIASLSGSHRFILDYLTEQVLDRQSPEMRQFLLQTSILDRLNGDLCNAVTGRKDGRRLLTELFNANLFVVPLDDEGQWYRYHHLFGDLLRGLRQALPEDEIADLHQRASHWYAQAGMVGEAIQHALAAEAYPTAVQLLEGHAMQLIMQGYAKTVNGWVQSIPADWAWQSPRTDLAFAWMHLLRGAYREAAPHLERVQALVTGDGEPFDDTEEGLSLEAEWLVMKSFLLLMEAKAAESAALATRALTLAPAGDNRVRSLAHWAVASLCQLMEAYADATEHYQMAIQQARVAENAVAEWMAVSGLTQMALERGQLRMAFEIASQAVERLERTGITPPISAVAYGALAQIHCEWLELDAARRQSECALELSTLGGYNSGMAIGHVFLSRILRLEGDVEMAAREVQSAVDLVQGQAPDYVRQEVAAQQVRIALTQDRLAAAEMALQGHGFFYQDQFSFPELPEDRRITHALGLLYNSSLRVLLHRARSRNGVAGLAAGMKLANDLIAVARQGHYLFVELEALLLRAQMRAVHETGVERLSGSQEDLVRALELAEAEGFAGIFLEEGPGVAEAVAQLLEQNRLRGTLVAYAACILDAFSKSGSRGVRQSEGAGPEAAPVTRRHALAEPLSERELEVLGLIADGLKYSEIAAELFISLNTVRFHVKAIYGKLGVNNRTQAVERARQLSLL